MKVDQVLDVQKKHTHDDLVGQDNHVPDTVLLFAREFRLYSTQKKNCAQLQSPYSQLRYVETWICTRKKRERTQDGYTPMILDQKKV